MRSRTWIALLFLCIAQPVLAQYDNVNLLLQSPDGKTVKLIWFIKKWSPEITGFDIKRKDGIKGWVKLNREPILPEISSQKKLSVVESDKAEEGRIKEKLYELLTAHNLQETGSKAYLQRLNEDDKAVQDIAMMIGQDYDLALMNGFAYVDHSATKRTEYQYGLFIQGTDKILDSISWRYGEIPDLNVVHEITSKATPGKAGIQLIWNVEPNKMRTADVRGFNIYREGIRLNTVPIVGSNMSDPSEFTWSDRSVNSAEPTQYSVSAESMFGIEGVIRSYRYDPADHPKEYRKAVVTDVASLGYYFKEGVSVKWFFPKETERFIKGFYLEKDNMPAGYKQVSGLLDPAARSITDTSMSQVAGYIRFRVMAIYKDRTKMTGTEKVYNYFPQRQPPVPQNVRARIVKEDKKNEVYLSWDMQMSGDSVTSYYRVYAADLIDGRMNLLADKLARKNLYIYNIEPGSTGTRKFCIAAVNKLDNESALSDTATVKMPVQELATPAINVAIADGNSIAISWTYASVNGLSGFRLYNNNVVTATEKELDKNTRQYTVRGLAEGSYTISLRAVVDDGAMSEPSVAPAVMIKKQGKK